MTPTGYRHETEAWNNKFNCRYEIIRLQTVKLSFSLHQRVFYLSFSAVVLRVLHVSIPSQPFSVWRRLCWHMRVKATFKNTCFLAIEFTGQCERSSQRQECLNNLGEETFFFKVRTIEIKQWVKEDLICISMEGPELQAFDPTPTVVKWFSSGKRPRRPNLAYRRWPDELISVAYSWDSPDFVWSS